MQYKKKIHRAFTLAEVLITLAIIGIVAAMTIPVVMNGTNNSETVAKVKKYQSIFSQAVMKYETDNACLGDLSACGGAFSGNRDPVTAWGIFKPYFNVVKDCGTSTGCFNPGVTYKNLNGTSAGILDNNAQFNKVVMADGTLLALFDDTLNCANNLSTTNSGPLYNSFCGSLYVDLNGSKGPNQYGRDVFAWYMVKSNVYPVGVFDDWHRGCDPSSNDITYDANGAPGEGIGCTSKILQDGAVNY